MPLTFIVTWLDSVPSTNDLVLEAIRAGAARPGDVYAAREQPGARGRQERRWIAAEGGLWFTAAMPVHAGSPGWAGILAALAVCRALADVGLRAGVKWPNDVVVGGGKLAGVLVETVAGQELAAVGVGLNVRNRLPEVGEHPAGRAQPWPPTSVVWETGRDVAPEELLGPVLERLAVLWERWAEGRTADLLAAWAESDACRGCRVRLLPGGPAGVADGIDASGALRVRLPDGSVGRAVAGELSYI
jgi:BirA family biotin operon repressor/biotin-[acetyl-CoA-carboxylase] ligase